jgi:hypothetical protein
VILLYFDLIEVVPSFLEERKAMANISAFYRGSLSTIEFISDELLKEGLSKELSILRE